VFGRLHVLPVMTAFLRAYHEISARMIFADRVVNLFEEPIDLAVRIGPLADSSLIAAKTGTIRRVVCGNPEYFAFKGKPEEPGDLPRHDCIAFEGLSPPRSWTFQAGRSQETVPVRPRLVVNSAEAAVDAAVAGLGITRPLFYQAADALRSGALITVLDQFEPAPEPVNLVYRGEGPLPQKVRAFLDFAIPRLKARVASLDLHDR
jgi:DNA-binding transcriptional LysR family regulator